MNFNGKDYKLYYLDTCALSELVKDRADFGSNLLNLVLSDGIIAISSYSLWELKSAPNVYKDVIEAITTLPTILLKDDATLIHEEYGLLDNNLENINSIGSYLLKGELKKQGVDVIALIDSYITDEKKVIFKDGISAVYKILKSEPSNIYSREELKLIKNIESSVSLVAYQMAYEYLAPQLDSYSNFGKEFPIRRFPSLISTSYILHYKYRQAERKSAECDIPDILISTYYPYVDVVITERNQCDIIKQIQKRHGFFTNLKAFSMKQVYTESYEA